MTLSAHLSFDEKFLILLENPTIGMSIISDKEGTLDHDLIDKIKLCLKKVENKSPLINFELASFSIYFTSEFSSNFMKKNYKEAIMKLYKNQIKFLWASTYDKDSLPSFLPKEIVIHILRHNFFLSFETLKNDVEIASKNA